MVNLKIQHHLPFFIPPKVLGKLLSLHILITLPIPHWQRSINLFPTLSNAHIALWHKTWHRQNLHTKICKHYWQNYFSWSSFWLPIPIPISWDYNTWKGFILLPDRFNWVNEPLNKALKTPLSLKKCLWNGVNLFMSNLQYIIVHR